MKSDAVMTISERYKYLSLVRPRYLSAASKETQSQLLDEMVAVTGLHRKSLIRLMRQELQRTPRTVQRGRHYPPEVDDAIRVIWESLDFICAERLKPCLPTIAQHLATYGELILSDTVLEHLGRISVSTLQRYLTRFLQDQPRRHRRKPVSPSSIWKEIPICRIPWDILIPGHFEVDLVWHCGFTTSGDFLCTLQLIDVATGWSERVAVLGRSSLVMCDAFRRIQSRIPFPIIELHPDNGSEFLNWQMIHFWQNVFQGVRISRSFPYHKNDNRFVEQKNASLVRFYLGFDRLDSVAQVNAVNQLYDQLWLYNNFFQPVLRLVEKIPTRSPEGVFRIKRRYDVAQTPFDRLCETEAISSERKESLMRLRQGVNPRLLREDIYQRIDSIFQLPGVRPGEFEDVRDTLFAPQEVT